MNGAIVARDINQLSPEQFDILSKAVAFDDLKKQYRTARTEANFDLDRQINSWLSNLTSKNTIRMYEYAIRVFLDFCGNDVLHVSVEKADEYVKHLLKVKNAGNTVSFYTQVASSFYSHLFRYDHVKRNPFLKGKVKINKAPVKDKVIPSQNDVKALREYFTKNMSVSAGNKMRLSLTILTRYGVRKGFLDDLRLEKNALVSMSKGKEYRVVLSDRDYAYFLKHEKMLNTLNSNTFSNNFNKGVNILHSRGVLENKFSAHCLRHKFAIEFYEKSGHDYYRLKEKLNHSSIAVTEKYLRGLKVA